MSSTSPPQLHLSLSPPHQSFKRSFQQFGLDVDSPGAAEASSSSSVASGSSTGASLSGSSSASSSSSQSSPSSGDEYGNERNKRARSEGPDRQSDNDEPRGRLGQSGGFTTSPPTLTEMRPLSVATFTSNISGLSSPQDGPSAASAVDAHSTQFAITQSTPHALRTGLSLSSPSSDRAATYSRSYLVSTTTAERPYSNLLHPRLSSPIPPPRLDEDFLMGDDVQDSRFHAPRSHRLPFIQTRQPAEVHEESVRDTLERAQAFDRSIAPLRSDPSELLGSQQRVAEHHSIGIPTTGDSFHEDFDSLRADASGSPLVNPFDNEMRSESRFLTDFELAPRSASSRFPRTGGLRPATRYSQAPTMYRPRSPPSPPPRPQRFSLPPRPALRFAHEYEPFSTGFGHQPDRVNEMLLNPHPPARMPSPEIPTFHNDEAANGSNNGRLGVLSNTLRQHIEGLLDDLHESLPLFPLSIETGDMSDLLGHDEHNDRDEDEQEGVFSLASEGDRDEVMQNLHDVHMQAEASADRIYRAVSEHIEASSSGSTMDSMEPIRPLQREDPLYNRIRASTIGNRRITRPEPRMVSTYANPRFEARTEDNTGPSHRPTATAVSSPSSSHGQSSSYLPHRPTMRMRRLPPRAEMIEAEERTSSSTLSRPHLPALTSVFGSDSLSSLLSNGLGLLNDIEMERPRALVEEIERDLPVMRDYYMERSRESELLRRTAGRTPPPQTDTLNLSLGPSITDIFHGPRIEGANGERSGGLFADEEFRREYGSLLTSVRHHLSQLERPEHHNAPSANRPSLSTLREMNRLPIRMRPVAERAMEHHATFEPPATASRARRNAFSDRRDLDTSGSAGASSSEAAAYFASSRNTYSSGPSSVATRQLRHPNGAHNDVYPRTGPSEPIPGLLRHPRLDRPEDLSSSMDSIRGRSSDSSSDSNLVRPPTPPAPEVRNSNAGSELLNLMYPGRFSSALSNAEERNLENTMLRPMRELGHSASYPEGIRRHVGLSQPAEPSPTSGMRHRPERVPTLPPLRFQPTFEPVGRDASAQQDGAIRPEAQRSSEVPWRRPFGSRIDQPVSGGLMAEARRSTGSHFHAPPFRNHMRQNGEPNVDAAFQRARMLRSLETRFEAEEERYRPVPASGRVQGFQRAMNVLRGDGLSSMRQNQFESVFERQQQRASAPMGPRENHTHWGEIRGDNDRPHVRSLFSSRRGSALFADPPDNADNAPPNRGSGSATNAHSTNHQGLPSSPMEFFSRFSGRPRVRNRARSMRQGEDAPPSGGIFGGFRFMRRRSGGSLGLGDFMRDEDFDSSYESLLALAASLGDAKPRATPADHIAALPTAFYKDWQTPESDARCPICLDDYKSLDTVLKAEPCDHWCHKECLEQWLHSARTCPVCRGKINPRNKVSSSQPTAGPSNTNRHDEDDEDSSDDSSSSSTPSPFDHALFVALSSEIRRELL